MAKQDIICIGCPMGCPLTVEVKGDTIDSIVVEGHLCKIGVTYAQEEMTTPTRNITTSVKVDGGDIPMLSVKTARPIPKGMIMECNAAVHAVRMKAPVKVGDVVLANACGTGVDFVATRDIVAV